MWSRCRDVCCENFWFWSDLLLSEFHCWVQKHRQNRIRIWFCHWLFGLHKLIMQKLRFLICRLVFSLFFSQGWGWPKWESATIQSTLTFRLLQTFSPAVFVANCAASCTVEGDDKCGRQDLAEPRQLCWSWTLVAAQLWEFFPKHSDHPQYGANHFLILILLVLNHTSLLISPQKSFYLFVEMYLVAYDRIPTSMYMHPCTCTHTHTHIHTGSHTSSNNGKALTCLGQVSCRWIATATQCHVLICCFFLIPVGSIFGNIDSSVIVSDCEPLPHGVRAFHLTGLF